MTLYGIVKVDIGLPLELYSLYNVGVWNFLALVAVLLVVVYTIG